MRTRRLLAALALVLVGSFSVAGVAGAQEANTDNPGATGDTETHELTHENEECIELLESGKDVDDCQEAPSPILPATNELIWGAISFLVLLGLMAKFALPNIKNMMDERTERIRGDLDAAESAKTEAVGIREEYARQLADAKAEAARIIEEARQAADTVRKDLTQRAEAEAAELRQRNAEQLEGERARIMGELQGQVATLAIELAEKVVEANLDRDAQNRLIESYISSVASK
jgi:F-type H+-transporting ATPase subunit b